MSDRKWQAVMSDLLQMVVTQNHDPDFCTCHEILDEAKRLIDHPAPPPHELREALEKCIDFIVRKPNTQYAYSRCGYCNLPWWDDKERHNFGCIIPIARTALVRVTARGTEETGGVP